MALSGKQKSAGGFIWKKGWGKAQIDLSNYIFGEALRAQRNFKKVRQYSVQGRLLKTFPSIKDAAAALGISPSYISIVLNKEKLVKGFKWRT